MDVAPPSGLAWRPGIRTTWEPASAEPRYQYLDLVPKGRDDEGFKFPMEWVRRHDQY